MKIVVAGDWHSELHEEAVHCALLKLGHESIRFAWNTYFRTSGPLAPLASLPLRFQNKFMLGPRVDRLNRDLVDCVAARQPEAVFIYRGTHIYARTLRRIKQVAPGVVLIGYNNDDPFSPRYPGWFWRHFLAAMPEYDLMLAYRQHNLQEFRLAGAKRVELLRSWFISERNRPVVLAEEDCAKYRCDVVFVGHYEDDGRLQCLEEVVRRGWKLNLFGHDYGWRPAVRKSPILRGLIPSGTVWGEDYNKALCGARVALCFLSKLNRDTYTRRCFEIPASGTLMLAEYTEDLAGLFRAGEEADFFRSPAELIEKLDIYLHDEALRVRVADAGRRKVALERHDVVSRMECVIEWIRALQDGVRERA